MNEPENQGQHRISQVYLKQFGYQKDDDWWVSVYQIGKKTTDNKLVNDFTKETNIFDVPFKDFKIRRHFENTSSLIESRYRTVISNLTNQKQLIPKDRDLLCHFVPNLMCRTKPFRSFIDLLLRDRETRDKFINEITLLRGVNEETRELLSIFKIDFQLNVVVGVVIEHLVTVLRQFKQVIIRDAEDKGWMTTDTPVFIDKQEHHEWIMPIEAELYFPLSRDYCLFMYHEKSEIDSNPLRKLKENKINTVNFETFDEITKRIVYNANEFIIMPTQMQETDVTGES
jgi:hypothetical protein